MLYILAVVVVLAGMVMLVILPVRERADALDQEIFDAQIESDAMEMLIARVAGMNGDLERVNQDIEGEKDFYLPLMNSDDLDKYITGLLQSHGLVAQSLTIVTPGEQTGNELVQLFQVNVVASGRISQFVSLVETVKATDGVRISGLSFQQRATATPAPTPTPTPTPKQRNRKATPTPELTANPGTAVSATAQDPQYLMNISFVVAEYYEDGLLPASAQTPQPEATADPTLVAAGGE